MMTKTMYTELAIASLGVPKMGKTTMQSYKLQSAGYQMLMRTKTTISAYVANSGLGIAMLYEYVANSVLGIPNFDDDDG
jgi:hypothetical protein